MEIILLGIYSYFVYLVFFKFKWLPWNFVTQVIVVTIPIVGLTLLILVLNIVAPSSADVRVVNYVVAVNARIQGMVTEVPITPNQHIKRGEILFKLDPRPYEIEIQGLRAKVDSLDAKLLGANATTPAELRRAMEEAIRSRKPTLINAVIDETAGTESGRITSLNPTAAKKRA